MTQALFRGAGSEGQWLARGSAAVGCWTCSAPLPACSSAAGTGLSLPCHAPAGQILCWTTLQLGAKWEGCARGVGLAWAEHRSPSSALSYHSNFCSSPFSPPLLDAEYAQEAMDFFQAFANSPKQVPMACWMVVVPSQGCWLCRAAALTGHCTPQLSSGPAG